LRVEIAAPRRYLKPYLDTIFFSKGRFISKQQKITNRMHIPLYKYFSELPWIPVIPIYGYTALRIKALTSEEVLVNSSRHLEILDLYAQELNTDAILPLLDLTVEAEVLGAEVSYPPHDAPIIRKRSGLKRR
jgi:hypothetical protein